MNRNNATVEKYLKKKKNSGQWSCPIKQNELLNCTITKIKSTGNYLTDDNKSLKGIRQIIKVSHSNMPDLTPLDKMEINNMACYHVS